MSPHKDYQPVESDDCDTSFRIRDDLGKYWRRRFIALAVFTVVLLPVSCGASWWQGHTSRRQYGQDVKIPYSPATSHLRYLNKYMTQDPDTPKFMGKPRPELDAAWHDLLQGTMIKFSPDELHRAGNATSVAHKDGGYVGGLGISHSLHCLKRIKQYLYPDYYYNHEEQDWHELESHADHCLESLRQTLMCQPDVSVYTLEWTPHSRVKPTVRVPQAHACVDWSALHEWMLERAGKLEDMVPPDPSLYAAKGEGN